MIQGRIKGLKVSAELLVDFLKNPTHPGLTSEGIPDDAKILDCRWEDTGIVVLLIESATFPQVDLFTPPEKYQTLDVRFKREVAP